LSIEERAHAAGLQPMLARVHRAQRELGVPQRARRFGRGHASVTPREMEVLGLVAQGLTSRLIGARLGIAPATVDSLVRTATSKLGVRRRRQAAAAMSGVVPRRRLLAIAESDAGAAALVDAVRERGAEQRAGWLLPGVPWTVEGTVCVGPVRDRDDARKALLAATRGAHVVVQGPVPEGLKDELLDDLGRLGSVVVRGSEPVDQLRADERRLLELVAGGLSVREAARELHVSRRTADRLFASSRRVLGVDTNGEAVAAYVGSRQVSTARS
jgi:DNA-binding CsgD family transcriptional regulator